ncbi:MAG: response regulator [Phycisphaeraceae bacterium]
MLIVDDVKDVRDLLVRIVKLGGYSTLTATNGREALAAVTAHDPDLVLLDISMPDMDGFEVLQALNAIGDGPPPVYMMTAMTDEAMRDRALGLGAEGYFVKGDFDIDVLLDTLADRLAM